MRGHVLLDVPRAAVKDPHQRLLVEVTDLVLQRLNVVYVVAFWQAEIGNCGSGRGVVEEREDLRR